MVILNKKNIFLDHILDTNCVYLFINFNGYIFKFLIEKENF